jgi:hypothetical protein
MFRAIPPIEVAKVVWEAYHSNKLHWYVPPEIYELDGQAVHLATVTTGSTGLLANNLIVIKDSETNLRRVIDTIPTLAWCNSPDGPNRRPPVGGQPRSA